MSHVQQTVTAWITVPIRRVAKLLMVKQQNAGQDIFVYRIYEISIFIGSLPSEAS